MNTNELCVRNESIPQNRSWSAPERRIKQYSRVSELRFQI